MGVKPTGLSNGVWNLSFEPNWGSAVTALNALAAAQTDWKPAFLAIADKIDKQASRSIGSATGPDDYRWRELTDRYQRSAQKGGSRAMLVLSGKLRSATRKGSAVENLTNTSMGYRVRSRYASAHQFGAHPTAAGHPGTRVRNYILWGDSMKKVFFDEMAKHNHKRVSQIMRGVK